MNAIPFEAWMEVDMRSESPESLLGIERAFIDAMNRGLENENALRREGPLLEVELDRIGDRPSGELPPSTPLIQRTLAATAEFDVTTTLERSSTNSNIPIALGIPAITLGRGGVGGSGHAPGEWWITKTGTLPSSARCWSSSRKRGSRASFPDTEWTSCCGWKRPPSARGRVNPAPRFSPP